MMMTIWKKKKEKKKDVEKDGDECDDNDHDDEEGRMTRAVFFSQCRLSPMGTACQLLQKGSEESNNNTPEEKGLTAVAVVVRSGGSEFLQQDKYRMNGKSWFRRRKVARLQVAKVCIRMHPDAFLIWILPLLPYFPHVHFLRFPPRCRGKMQLRVQEQVQG